MKTLHVLIGQEVPSGAAYLVPTARSPVQHPDIRHPPPRRHPAPHPRAARRARTQALTAAPQVATTPPPRRSSSASSGATTPSPAAPSRRAARAARARPRPPPARRRGRRGSACPQVPPQLRRAPRQQGRDSEGEPRPALASSSALAAAQWRRKSGSAGTRSPSASHPFAPPPAHPPGPRVRRRAPRARRSSSSARPS
jgi:hypothetical protein